MGKKPPSKRPRPSHEEGELRDKSIEKLADPDFQESDFLNLIKKAASSRRKPANGQ
jgi:hypothetical protein